jgi:hypothetical protein
MSAIRVGDSVALIFTKVLDLMTLGALDEDEELAEVTDRAYWERRAPRTLGTADGLFETLRSFDTRLEPKYNKFYIGLARDGIPDNFVTVQPLKNHVRVGIRLSRSEDVEGRLEASGIDLMRYSDKSGRYWLRLRPGDEKEHKKLLEELFSTSFKESRPGAADA